MGLFIICTNPLHTRVCKWCEVEAEHGMGVLKVGAASLECKMENLEWSWSQVIIEVSVAPCHTVSDRLFVCPLLSDTQKLDALASFNYI